MKIEKIIEERKQRPSGRLAEVYYSPDRPGMTDIQADFDWRRGHKPPKVIPQIRDTVMKILVDKFGAEIIGDFEIRYSKHCGCNMCPCSPGWVVKTKNCETFEKLLIWMED